MEAANLHMALYKSYYYYYYYYCNTFVSNCQTSDAGRTRHRWASGTLSLHRVFIWDHPERTFQKTRQLSS